MRRVVDWGKRASWHGRADDPPAVQLGAGGRRDEPAAEGPAWTSRTTHRAAAVLVSQQAAVHRRAHRPACAAPVSVATSENKPNVVKEAVDVAAVGDDEPVALLDRPWVQHVRADPIPIR
jgi:hypothetical protein